MVSSNTMISCVKFQRLPRQQKYQRSCLCSNHGSTQGPCVITFSTSVMAGNNICTVRSRVIFGIILPLQSHQKLSRLWCLNHSRHHLPPSLFWSQYFFELLSGGSLNHDVASRRVPSRRVWSVVWRMFKTPRRGESTSNQQVISRILPSKCQSTSHQGTCHSIIL